MRAEKLSGLRIDDAGSAIADEVGPSSAPIPARILLEAVRAVEDQCGPYVAGVAGPVRRRMAVVGEGGPVVTHPPTHCVQGLASAEERQRTRQHSIDFAEHGQEIGGVGGVESGEP